MGLKKYYSQQQQVIQPIFITNILMNQLHQLLLRPPRQTYYNHDLGPQFCYINGMKVKRTQFSVYNHSKKQLSASLFHFYPNQQQCKSARTHHQQIKNYKVCQRTVIYLHTYYGSKIQGLFLKQNVMELGYNFCVFDFCGYGNSKQQFVTLGIRQSQDISHVIKTLKQNFGQQQFVLWGRSMGAVAALLYLSNDKQNQNDIKCAVFDSPFSSLSKSVLEIASNRTGLPEKLFSPFLYLLQKSIKGQIDFSQLQLPEKISKINIPGIFIASKYDKFISHHHSQKLYRAYRGRKQLYYIEKDHNQHRSNDELQSVFEFIKQCCEIMSIDPYVQKYLEKLRKNSSLRVHTSSNQLSAHSLEQIKQSKYSKKQLKIKLQRKLDKKIFQ